MLLVTFNRQLEVPLDLPDGTHLPRGSFLSIPNWPVMRDPKLFANPDTFEPARFSHAADGDKWAFSSYGSDWPGWGTGKFACPGRFWAGAQMKLGLITLLDQFDLVLPEGQTGRPQNMVHGESCLPDFGQSMKMKRR